MTRGILYIVWGNYNRAELQRSINSLRPFGYDYHVAEIEDEGIGLAHKSRMYDLSPFDTTLFLDTDTEVRGNLDYGFEMAERHGIACCIAPASSAYLAGKDIGMKLNPDAIQYNTGVVFFSKHAYEFSPVGDDDEGEYFPIVDDFFNHWFDFACEDYPKSSKNDQPSFSLALSECGINPFILPRNWNWRQKIRYEGKVLHGELKILHAR